MGKILLLVGIGGFIGSIARYSIGVFTAKHFSENFPYGTFAVNILGCLLIGIIYGLSEKHDWMTNEWRLFLAAGICGGFTTFSGFSLENLTLLENNNYSGFFIYAVGSLILGLIAVWGGLTLIKSI